jgi:diaminopimelate decarboxylase
MDAFNYINGQLCCEDLPVADIVAQAGSPVYIYSKATLLDHYTKLASSFADVDTTVCYSIKTLSNLSILNVLKGAGSGFDVVSGGELARAMAIGADPQKIVYAGVGKTDAEIRYALECNIGWFNIESEMEFETISAIAAEMGVKTRGALRINPDVYDPKTHAYTTTGKKETKFGVDIDRAEDFFDRYGRDEHVKLDSIHLHIGSPIYSADPYVAALKKALVFIDAIRAKGMEINVLDLGGGFAADYETGKSPLAADYAAEILPLIKQANVSLILEPGRHIACNAGILATKVLYTKTGGEKKFLIADAAMTDLLRPALYQAEHFVYPVQLADGAPAPEHKIAYAPEGGVTVDIVGGVCETSDTLAHARTLPPMTRGDLLAIFGAGAYGFVMASTYNTRPRPAEVLVDGDTFKVIRPRETAEEIFAPEQSCL